MNEDIIIPVSFFAFIFAMLYVYWTTRNKERMALIEKGADPSLFKTKNHSNNFFTLKTGLFFVGIALGVLFGNILDMSTALDSGTAYVSMIFLFGGSGLIAGYWIQSKKENH